MIKEINNDYTRERKALMTSVIEPELLNISKKSELMKVNLFQLHNLVILRNFVKDQVIIKS